MESKSETLVCHASDKCVVSNANFSFSCSDQKKEEDHTGTGKLLLYAYLCVHTVLCLYIRVPQPELYRADDKEKEEMPRKYQIS